MNPVVTVIGLALGISRSWRPGQQRRLPSVDEQSLGEGRELDRPEMVEIKVSATERASSPSA
jgi:hypothetical protein